jgi:ribosomal protein L32
LQYKKTAKRRRRRRRSGDRAAILHLRSIKPQTINMLFET